MKRAAWLFLIYLLITLFLALPFWLSLYLVRGKSSAWFIFFGTINSIVWLVVTFLLGYWGYKYMRGNHIGWQILAFAMAGIASRSFIILVNGQANVFLEQVDPLRFLTLGFIGMDKGVPHMAIAPDFLLFFLGMLVAYRGQKKNDRSSQGQKQVRVGDQGF